MTTNTRYCTLLLMLRVLPQKLTLATFLLDLVFNLKKLFFLEVLEILGNLFSLGDLGF